jgi:hypothetical protein
MNTSLYVVSILGALVVLCVAAWALARLFPPRKPVVWTGIVIKSELVPHHEGTPCCEHGENGLPIMRMPHTDVHLDDGSTVRLIGDYLGICAVGNKVRITLGPGGPSVARLP